MFGLGAREAVMAALASALSTARPSSRGLGPTPVRGAGAADDLVTALDTAGDHAAARHALAR